MSNSTEALALSIDALIRARLQWRAPNTYARTHDISRTEAETAVAALVREAYTTMHATLDSVLSIPVLTDVETEAETQPEQHIYPEVDFSDPRIQARVREVYDRLGGSDKFLGTFGYLDFARELFAEFDISRRDVFAEFAIPRRDLPPESMAKDEAAELKWAFSFVSNEAEISVSDSQRLVRVLRNLAERGTQADVLNGLGPTYAEDVRNLIFHIERARRGGSLAPALAQRFEMLLRTAFNIRS
jgi:hypothetical protein